MVYVVMANDGTVLQSMDAWVADSVERMYQWAERNGYNVLFDEITAFGNMVLYVEAKR